MSVDKSITIATLKQELRDCNEYCEKYGWKISDLNEENLNFTVLMISPVDKEEYHLAITGDNYPEWPLLIDFFDPVTEEKGTKKCYPQGGDSFFHPGLPCICNPCSRKSYKKFIESAPHGDWELNSWKTYSEVGTLTKILNILRAIYGRISDPDPNNYRGRMQK